MSPPTAFRMASPGDRELVLAMMDRFNASQGYPSDADVLGPAFDRFVASPELGRLWILEHDKEPVGYLVLAFGFSFEFGGRDAFVDEFFVESSARGRGLGQAALDFAASEARALGVHALHLEVEPGNPARRLYERSGFRPDGRHLLSKPVEARDGES